MAAPGIWGDEFLVNAVTEGAQMSPTLAALTDGRFAVAYTDYSATTAFGFTDTDRTAIRAQVFNGDGTASSAPVQVNTVETYYQRAPEIAATADGGFVVAFADLSIGWDTNDDDIWGDAVRMQRFTGDAVRLGPETRVNTTVYGDQDYPRLAVLSDGRLVVTWDDGYAVPGEDIHAQIFEPDGRFAGAETAVNAGTDGAQTGSWIAALDDGRYVVTWTDASGADGDGAGVAARLFNADGTPASGDIRVNGTTLGDQYEATVAPLAGGGFVVVWTDSSRGVETGGDDSSSSAVRGQVFDRAGRTVGDEFLVNQTTTYGQSQPSVLALSDGRFITAWSDTSGGLETGGDDTSYGAIRARIFGADGTPAGDEFLVPLTTAGHQNEPRMTELLDGRVVFTWTDYSIGVDTGGDDTSNAAIRARILDPRLSGVAWTGTEADEQFTGTQWRDTLSGENGADRIFGGDKGDRISGGADNDRLWGGDGNDRIFGDSGRDLLHGDTGRDRLLGGGGVDVLDGAGGRDIIDGGRRGDVITGGGGADTLTGGGGSDVFVYTSTADSGRTIAKRDTITDFTPGKDLIDLVEIDADSLTPGDDAFAFIGRNGFTGMPGELRYKLTRSTTIIKADIDGDGVVDMKIVLDDPLVLHADDFLL